MASGRRTASCGPRWRAGGRSRRVAEVRSCADEHNLTITIFGGARAALDRPTTRRSRAPHGGCVERTSPACVHRGLALQATPRSTWTVCDVPEDCGPARRAPGRDAAALEEERARVMFFARTALARRAHRTSRCRIRAEARARGAELKACRRSSTSTRATASHARARELREIERVKGDENEDGWARETCLLTEENWPTRSAQQGRRAASSRPRGPRAAQGRPRRVHGRLPQGAQARARGRALRAAARPRLGARGAAERDDGSSSRAVPIERRLHHGDRGDRRRARSSRARWSGGPKIKRASKRPRSNHLTPARTSPSPPI